MTTLPRFGALGPLSAIGQGVDPRTVPLPDPGERVRVPFAGLYGELSPTTSSTIFTEEGNKLANSRMYGGVSPQQPYTFDVCTFTTPSQNFLLIQSFSFNADRFGPAGPLDLRPLEHGRLRTSWVWDITVQGQQRNRQTSFQIVPTPIVQLGAGNGLGQLPLQNAYASVAAAQAQSVGGSGLAGLPFEGGRIYGPTNGPFTLLVEQQRVVSIRCSLIRPLAIPIAQIRARIDGFLFGQNLLETYQEAIRP